MKKLGIMEGFLTGKLVSIFDFNQFLGKVLQGHLEAKQIKCFLLMANSEMVKGIKNIVG